jgi:hypothetical protein
MPDATRTGSVVADYDRDSIHTLPLSIVPVTDPALAKARLIKNHRLETKIELFREAGVGSAQIGIEEVPDFFGSDPRMLADDLALLRRLGSLPAFDPFTLRVGLRRAGVDVLTVDAFQLSAAKRAELFPLMRNVTRPLIAYLYGGGAVEPDDLDTLVRLVARPDAPRVRARLDKMAAALGVATDKLPDMLESYGDTQLALSYYRSYFRYALPALPRIVGWMAEIKDNAFVRGDPTAGKSIQQVETGLTRIAESATRRFEGFDKHTVVRWHAITLGAFGGVRDLIARHQESLAEVLCGLTVKIFEWEQRFPNAGGSPEKRVEFIGADLKPGLDKLWAVERRAPSFDAAS